MNLLTGNIRQAYFRYLSAAFGEELISSIYYLVDMAMVGQYQGPWWLQFGILPTALAS